MTELLVGCQVVHCADMPAVVLTRSRRLWWRFSRLDRS